MKYQIDFRNYGWAIIFLFFLLLSTKTFFNIPLILLSISGIYVLIKNKTIDMGKANIRLFGIMYLCIIIPMVLSLFDAVSFNESFRKIMSFMLYYFIGVAVILSLRDTKHRKYFLASIFFMMCFWIIDATWQSISEFNILGYPYNAEGHGASRRRLTGMFYPRAIIGLILAILSPFYFEFIRQYYHKTKWIVLLILLLIYVIYLSGSRASYVMLLISMFFYSIFLISIGFVSKINKNHVIITLSIILFSSIIITNIGKVITDERKDWLTNRIYSIGHLLSGDINKVTDAVPGRVGIWEGALWVAKDNWVNGIGPRGFRYVVDDYIENREGHIISEYARSSTHPHQYVLEILTETGVIGLLGYLMFLVILYRRIYVYFKNEQYRHYLPWTFPALIATLPINMHMAFYGNYISVLIWVTVAIVMSLEIGNNSNTAKQKHD
jgi:O-antigen ligase